MTRALLAFHHLNFIRKKLTAKYIKTQAETVTSNHVLGEGSGVGRQRGVLNHVTVI